MKKIDILYIVGVGSKWNDNELRYSLRSIEKYSKDYGNIYITGDKFPEFLNPRKVNYLPVPDCGCPSINHWRKVYCTATCTDISNKFLLMYDDVFITNPTSLVDYPYYNRGPIPKCNGTIHSISLDRAKFLLSELGKPTLHYGVHCPIIYEKDKFLQLSKFFNNKYINDGVGLSVRCMYGNYFNLGGPEVEDCKIIKPMEYQKIREYASNHDCISICDKSLNYDMKIFLEIEYANKSDWEMDEWK